MHGGKFGDSRKVGLDEARDVGQKDNSYVQFVYFEQYHYHKVDFKQ
jgi:hypothetical protein